MTRNWHAATAPLRQEFRTLLDPQRLRVLHRTSGWRHGAVAVRQFLLAAAAAWLIVRFQDPWIWLPAAVLLGFLVFGFTVLLHEVVHRAVFRRRHGPGNRLLAWLYAVPSGLAPSQFERWHLDHHAELGTDEKDPKRHYLTPKIVRRWFKLLYFTPALFPIYFRAAAREAAHYPKDLRARLRKERLAVTTVHLALMAAIVLLWGWGVLLELYVIPVFFVFPIAFTINRLGQHYDITPEDPAGWGTIIRTNPAWDLLFLWSSYHMEHHYFPAVPFYNLPALHDELAPIFARHKIRIRTYSGLLYDWLIRNRPPHETWDSPPSSTP
ncbi:MAG: fatty acid desaturase family protein [Planctomycetota bacterium]|jgi:fatty acid desaturase